LESVETSDLSVNGVIVEIQQLPYELNLVE
jgi:hypothetical protein